jgi:adenosylcobinamide kinase/adenosylcobinamide-phosphate guanylyltransferase
MSAELILGGARSGKSHYALTQALAHAALYPHAGTVCWIATAQAFDLEMHERIVHHQAERPTDWHTLEAPLSLSAALRQSTASLIVVDCLTLWLSNWLCRDPHGLDAADWLAEREQYLYQLQQLTQCPNRRLLLVSNEVGFGIVPDNPMARRFRDDAGRLHQHSAAIADRVTLVVAGIAMTVKAPSIL